MTALPPGYPVPQAIGPYREDIGRYLRMLFEHVDFNDGDFIVFRGIPERGTPMEGREPIDVPVQCIGDFDLVEVVVELAQRWASMHYATYIIPAVLKGPKGVAENVYLMSAVMVDIDSGDIHGAIEHAIKHLGNPTMVVHSGGGTVGGQGKAHLYYALREPTSDILKVMRARDGLAKKLGGDRAFGIADHGKSPVGRAHQPIRIPGTVHSKGMKAGQASTVRARIEYYDPEVGSFELDELLEGIETMPPVPGVTLPAQPEIAPVVTPTGDLTFSADYRDGPAKGPDPLITQIHEGGEEDRNRWSEFSRVAGEYIAQARTGRYDRAQAFNLTAGWMHAMMVPPWPLERAQREFGALWERDRIANADKWAALEGQKLAAGAAVTGPRKTPYETMVELTAPILARIADEPLPPRDWLVESLIAVDGVYLFVADSGIGKTNLFIDLAARIAGAWHDEHGNPGPDNKWCGLNVVTRPRTTVILTAEDSDGEIRSRLKTILTGQQMHRVSDRVRIVTLADTVGPFPLAAMERVKDAQGNIKDRLALSDWWGAFVHALAPIPNLGLVIVDPAAPLMHGDETDATIAQQFMWALGEIWRRYKVPVMVAHHTRKEGDRPVDSAKRLRAAIRGSSAFVSVPRCVMGIWTHPNQNRQKRALGISDRPGDQVFIFAVLKANSKRYDEEVPVVRDTDGVLRAIDVSRVAQVERDEVTEDDAWLVAAVEQAAQHGQPFSTGTGRNGFLSRTKGAAGNRHRELPDRLRRMPRERLGELVDRNVKLGRLVVASMLGQQDTAAQYLDIPTGSVARQLVAWDAGALRIVDWSGWAFDQYHSRVAPIPGKITIGT